MHMAKHKNQLLNLCRCFRGDLPEDVDWMRLIDLANRTLTTPALMDFVERHPNAVPEDVGQYLREIFQRNLTRNRRLASQLNEAVWTLNTQGIAPVLMKGSAFLMEARGDDIGRRLISDLDVLVSPEEKHSALNCLFDAGYRVHDQTPGEATRWHADLQRPDDVGMIDLQQDPPGHAFFYRSSGNLKHHCHFISGEASAYTPDPTFHALMLIIHDQFQDSDYWTGHIDLRHLLDLRDLARSTDGIDWQRLASLAPSKLARNALETQLVTLHALLDVDVPLAMRNRLAPKLQTWRRRLQSRAPALRPALLPMMLLDFRNYRTEIGAEERARKQLKPKKWVLPKATSMRFLFTLAGEQRIGKV